jgi:endonuclease/exonuclease/phosphatase family metal-dependent hydrolase
MAILRVMTYALAETSVSETDGVARLIRAQRPELVFLQHLPEYLLEGLAKETGLTAYAAQGDCGFLSRHPLIALQSVSLGGEGNCLRADLDLAGKRLHLFNVQLVLDPTQRGRQVARLFSEDLLGASLPCATLVAGDFSLPLWGGGQWLLNRRLQQVRHPVWGANYPAAFPLWPRDRFYLRGPIRSLAGQVVTASELRRTTSHLPVITTLELTDTRIYLKVPEVSEQRMRTVAG